MAKMGAVLKSSKMGKGLKGKNIPKRPRIPKRAVIKESGFASKNFSGTIDNYRDGLNLSRKNKTFKLDKVGKDVSKFKNADIYDRMGHSKAFRGKTKQQAASEYRNLGAIGSTVKDNIGLTGGWRTMAGHAGVGAIAGGAVGAGVNAMRGEDVWDGAMNGAALGAMGNVTVRGSKMAMGVNKETAIGDAFSSFNAETGMTKSVKSLHKMRKDSAYANKMLKQAQVKNK